MNEETINCFLCGVELISDNPTLLYICLPCENKFRPDHSKPPVMITGDFKKRKVVIQLNQMARDIAMGPEGAQEIARVLMSIAQKVINETIITGKGPKLVGLDGQPLVAGDSGDLEDELPDGSAYDDRDQT